MPVDGKKALKEGVESAVYVGIKAIRPNGVLVFIYNTRLKVIY